MIDFFSKWAEGIIVVSIIGVIIEMILPEGNNKKYIKMVIGVCVLFSIISPILSKFNKDIEINSDIYEKYFEDQTISNVVAKDNNINKIYESNIKTSIKTELMNIGYTAENIEVSISAENAEKIEYLKMNIKKNKKIDNVEKVNKVQIGNNNQEETTKQVGDEEVKKVKDFLSTNYGVEKENIIIN